MAVVGSIGMVSARDSNRSLKRMTVGTRDLEVLKSGGVDKYAGYSPLPARASESQCGLALQRIVMQPQSCAQKYMSGAARNIYLPIYQWFVNETLVSTALQFAGDNGVGVEVFDAFGNVLVQITTSGAVGSTETDPFGFDLSRTWALNYPTFLRQEAEGIASITQNIWNVDGQLLTIEIAKDINSLPVIC